MSNEKTKNTIHRNIIAVLCAILLCSIFTNGYYIYKSRHYRTVNTELREQFDSLTRQVEDYRTTIKLLTERLSNANIELERITRELGTYQSELTTSLGEVQTIRDAAERIREQTIILENYCRSVSRLYNSITSP